MKALEQYYDVELFVSQDFTKLNLKFLARLFVLFHSKRLKHSEEKEPSCTGRSDT